jgi:hypothetical protein
MNMAVWSLLEYVSTTVSACGMLGIPKLYGAAYDVFYDPHKSFTEPCLLVVSPAITINSAAVDI